MTAVLERYFGFMPDWLIGLVLVLLAIACALVEIHGGELSVKSQVGVGTTVEILVPHSRVTLGKAA